MESNERTWPTRHAEQLQFFHMQSKLQESISCFIKKIDFILAALPVHVAAVLAMYHLLSFLCSWYESKLHSVTIYRLVYDARQTAWVCVQRMKLHWPVLRMGVRGFLYYPSNPFGAALQGLQILKACQACSALRLASTQRHSPMCRSARVAVSTGLCACARACNAMR